MSSIQVYCDGACKPNPGIMYIGVYCAKPSIEIAIKQDKYGTNNEAECLAAIAGLEECKRIGLTDVELLTDSQLVIGWTTGTYKWYSETASEYVPGIRKLLKEINARINWIPSKKNLADRLSKSLMPTNQDYELAAKKSGRDEFSKMSKSTLIKALGENDWRHICSKIDKEKYQLNAARWVLRGLPLDTAIRKIEVQREIGHDFYNRFMAYDD